MPQTIAILDFGSQYTQLIARRIRECSVYSKIYPYATTAEQLKEEDIHGIILSGGPKSVLAADAPLPDPDIFSLKIPILGICYGLQLFATLPGAKVERGEQGEYGPATLKIHRQSTLLEDLPQESRVWNSHGDRLVNLPHGFHTLASTDNAHYAAIEHPHQRRYGLQFHPEVSHTQAGKRILDNFVKKICGCSGSWSMHSYQQEAIQNIRSTVGSQKVILGLSGGVDSAVVALLLHQAIGQQLTCIFVDNGLCRLNERQKVEREFHEHLGLNLRIADAGEQFLRPLQGITDPEQKRKIIGKTFIQVFEQEIAQIGKVDFLAQGTLYSDVIESSGLDGNPAAVIKSHHNVGGLPEKMRLQLIEPLRFLFKDEVRALGAELGLSASILHRQPFPGPGLAIRIIGEVLPERLTILRQADALLEKEIKRAGYYEKLWQSFAIFLPIRTVGVMGDDRTYDSVIALRIVESQDAMTADWARLPYDLLQHISNRIINEVKGINRVVLDISSKPPSTIEWE